MTDPRETHRKPPRRRTPKPPAAHPAQDPLGPRLRAWFTRQGWAPWPFQEQAWAAHAAGRSGLIYVPTGAGKTYAAYLAALAEALEDPGDRPCEQIRILYISPLRAVSRDIALAMQRPIDDLRAHDLVRVETRTGDTSSSVRARQRDRLPTVLITTPESLTLLLAQEACVERFATLRTVIVDEWHELLSSKRGTQTELAMARLRRIAPAVRTWALSATLANLEEAARGAVGVGSEPVLISGRVTRPVILESVLPGEKDPFPWAGHLGLSMLPRVVGSIETDEDGLPAHSTLVFTNTRSQSERWFHALALAKPEWEPVIALHHGSVDREERERVEAGLKDGSVRIVVATSSLDLGVDFAPVERVLQIGSPKGIARIMQRAGRASHRPGAACRIACVPTHGLEMIEIAAVRRAIRSGLIEPRVGERAPLDVLTQHMVTRALGGGFRADELFEEVRTAWAYRDLDRAAFDWALALVERGGATLGAYAEYHRVAPDDSGVYRVPDRRLASLHRMNVGTITGDATVDIRYVSGKRLGSIEESFVQKLRAGETFVFAGKTLEFVRMKDLTAIVRPSRGRSNHTPLWSGTRLPISESLGEAVRSTLEYARDVFAGGPSRADGIEPELLAARRLLEIQSRLSVVPGAGEVLVELCRTRDGQHLFVYPFDGRLVHGGLAALTAYRISRRAPVTLSLSANDYGFELLCADGFEFSDHLTPELFSADGFAADAAQSVNLSALARAQFREVARVSGLVFQSQPGARRSMRHVHARAGLLYDVFEQFDPENLLLQQARREVLEKQFEQSRLGRTLARLRAGPLRIVRTERPTPLSLPLIVERMGGQVSSQTLADRIAKMEASWR